MAWYHFPGHEQDVAVATRVRLSRNVEGAPYPARLDAAGARELLDRAGSILERNGFRRQDFADLSRQAVYALAERQYIGAAALRESLPHALFLNEPCNLAVTVCAEEHIRLQSIRPGLELQDALRGALEVEAILDEELPFAFHETLGYLSRCPADLGTGMRASVLLCLSRLESTGRLGELSDALGRTGHTLRRCGGGSLYILSHRATSGISEEEIIHTLDAAARHIIDAERRAREISDRDELDSVTDRLLRTEAILRVTRRLSEEELPELLGDLRLGAAMGILPSVRVEAVTVALIETQPAGLRSDAEAASEGEIQARRACAVRERIWSESALDAGECVPLPSP